MVHLLCLCVPFVAYLSVCHFFTYMCISLCFMCYHVPTSCMRSHLQLGLEINGLAMASPPIPKSWEPNTPDKKSTPKPKAASKPRAQEQVEALCVLAVVVC